MKRPRKAKPISRWSKWPQGLAKNEVRSLYPRGCDTVWRRGYAMIDIVLECGKALAKRAKVKLEDVVVFYPQAKYQSILWRLRCLKKEGRIAPYKGLTISGTRKLEANCMAFLIADVEAHRTPADAYYTMLHPNASRANPIPLYDENENEGKAVHQ